MLRWAVFAGLAWCFLCPFLGCLSCVWLWGAFFLYFGGWGIVPFA